MRASHSRAKEKEEKKYLLFFFFFLEEVSSLELWREREEEGGEKTILKADKSNIVHSIYGLSAFSSLRQSVPNLFIRL